MPKIDPSKLSRKQLISLNNQIYHLLNDKHLTDPNFYKLLELYKARYSDKTCVQAMLPCKIKVNIDFDSDDDEMELLETVIEKSNRELCELCPEILTTFDYVKKLREEYRTLLNKFCKTHKMTKYEAEYLLWEQNHA